MVPAGRSAWWRFKTITKPFFQSEQRWLGIGLFALVIVLLFAISGLNVVASYMNRDCMTAVADRDSSAFFKYLLLWAAVFLLATGVAAFKQYAEETLGLRWREWLTRHLVRRYLARHAYYRLRSRADVDNPDQRITEDVKTFTTTALSIAFILLNAAIALCAFSGILWSISPWLFGAAALYALFGSGFTVLFGRRLIGLDVMQQKKEADYRYELIRVRDNAERVALVRSEAHEEVRLSGRLDWLVDNFRRIIIRNRNLAFFTIGYTYMIQIIPVLIAAPLFMQGLIEFGMITQAYMAFDHVLRAFAVVVTEFQRIISLAAVVERLGGFYEAMEEPNADKSSIETACDADRLAFERLTLLTPDEGRLLVEDLSLEMAPGGRLLVMGSDGSGRTSLLRAMVGLWKSGQGRITRPDLDDVMVLPQQPYLTAASLRQQFLYGVGRDGVSDVEILAAVRKVKFESVVERVGGLDVERDWPHLLSQSEQQQLAFARLLLANPRFAFLDEATSGLEPERSRHLFHVLSQTPISYVSVSADPGLLTYHDQLLKLHGNGAWTVVPCGQEAVSA
jgi:putative ATP-binding cassette transporter